MPYQGENQNKHEISTFSFVIMVGVALICDIISAALALIVIDGGFFNDIFVFFVNMGIWLWTFLKGMGWRGAIAGGAGTVIEFIPVINFLPIFTAEIVGLFIYSRVSEKALTQIAAVAPEAANITKKILAKK
jgi:hypothetical protein